MDPQANACSGMGIDKTEVFSTVYNVLLGEEEINDAVRKTELDYLDVLPSNTDLIGAEIELVDKKNENCNYVTLLQKFQTNTITS